MLGELRSHIPHLAEAVAQARAGRRPSYDWSETGAADAVRSARRSTQRKATTTRRPRVKKSQPPTSDYESLTASEVVGKLTDFTQEQLKATIAYERAHRKRATVIERAQSLREDEPYDGLRRADRPRRRAAADRCRRGDRAPRARVRGAAQAPRRGARDRPAPAQRDVVMSVPVLEVPTSPEIPTTPVVPDAPVQPAVPEPGPVVPDTPDGPEPAEPNDPLPADPDGPEVPPPNE